MLYRKLSCILLATAAASPTAVLSRSFSTAFVSQSSPVQRRLLRSTADSALKMSTTSTDVIPGRPTWQQTMLRIKDPAKVNLTMF